MIEKKKKNFLEHTYSHHYNWKNENKTKKNSCFFYRKVKQKEKKNEFFDFLQLLVFINTRIVFLANSSKDSDSVYSSIKRDLKLQ